MNAVSPAPHAAVPSSNLGTDELRRHAGSLVGRRAWSTAACRDARSAVDPGPGAGVRWR